MLEVSGVEKLITVAVRVLFTKDFVLELLGGKLGFVDFLTLTGGDVVLARKDCFETGVIFFFSRRKGAVTKLGLEGGRKNSGFKNVFAGLTEIVNRNTFFKNLICYKIIVVKTIEAEKKRGFDFNRDNFIFIFINVLLF